MALFKGHSQTQTHHHLQCLGSPDQSAHEGYVAMRLAALQEVQELSNHQQDH